MIRIQATRCWIRTRSVVASVRYGMPEIWESCTTCFLDLLYAQMPGAPPVR